MCSTRDGGLNGGGTCNICVYSLIVLRFIQGLVRCGSRVYDFNLLFIVLSGTPVPGGQLPLLVCYYGQYLCML